MKRIICICKAALMMCSLTACAGNLNHYTKKESEVLMETAGRIGQKSFLKKIKKVLAQMRKIMYTHFL